MLPFIGSAWETQTHKVMIIGESHYLRRESGNKSDQSWYDSDESNLTDRERSQIHTRQVINDADKYLYPCKAYTIFYNMKRAILGDSYKHQLLFPRFGYYNYFQRPAEKTGESILLSGDDELIAYETLKAIYKIVRPTALIFVSKKAYNSFAAWRQGQNDAVFPDSLYHSVSHPASAWWHKKEGIHGKAKFIDILNNKINFLL